MKIEPLVCVGHCSSSMMEGTKSQLVSPSLRRCSALFLPPVWRWIPAPPLYFDLWTSLEPTPPELSETPRRWRPLTSSVCRNTNTSGNTTEWSSCRQRLLFYCQSWNEISERIFQTFTTIVFLFFLRLMVLCIVNILPEFEPEMFLKDRISSWCLCSDPDHQKVRLSWPPAAARSAGDCRMGTQTLLWSRTLSTWREQKGLIRVDSTETLQLNLLSACKTQLATSLSASQVGWQNWAIYWWHHHDILCLYFYFFKYTYIALMPCTFYLFLLLYFCGVNNWMLLKCHCTLCNDNRRILILIVQGCCYMKDFRGFFMLAIP